MQFTQTLSSPQHLKKLCVGSHAVCTSFKVNPVIKLDKIQSHKNEKQEWTLPPSPIFSQAFLNGRISTTKLTSNFAYRQHLSQQKVQFESQNSTKCGMRQVQESVKLKTIRQSVNRVENMHQFLASQILIQREKRLQDDSLYRPSSENELKSIKPNSECVNLASAAGFKQSVNTS